METQKKNMKNAIERKKNVHNEKVETLPKLMRKITLLYIFHIISIE